MTTKLGSKKGDEKFNALHEQLESIADSYVADPKIIAEYLQFASKFYLYSPANTMLIHRQNPHATFVASFQAWRSQGHSVRRGETGMKIFVPVNGTFFKDASGIVKQLSQATEEERKLVKENKLESWQRLLFKIGTVFDIIQTNVPYTEYPKILTPGVSSYEHATIAERLAIYIQENVCDIKTERTEGATIFGSFTPKDNIIHISPALEDTARLSTLAHELGHAVMHNTQPELSAVEMEFQADAFSIMLHQELGLEVSEDTKGHLAHVFNEMKKEVESEAIKNALAESDKKNYVLSSQRRAMISSLKDVHIAYSEHLPRILKTIKDPSRPKDFERTDQEK